MKVFVTGATGFVGSAVVAELIGAGHQVLGLARNDANAAKLEAAGAQVHRGDLEDLDSLKRGAGQADAVIHTGFIHDFSRFAEVCAVDQKAITAMGEALEGTGKPLIVTSGVAFLAPGAVATEDMSLPADSPVPRRSEQAAMAFVDRGVRAMCVRLSPSTHGDGDYGFVPMVIGISREKGASAYIGAGENRWPGVHRLDAARLFRLALEKGVAGARYHAVADQGVPVKAIAEVIGRRLNVPVVSVTPDEAAAHFGWFAMFAAIDCASSSAKTQAELGWTPTEIGLLEDLDNPRYFQG